MLWRRAMITCFFGLIHGLGFASALRDIGLGTIPGGVIGPLLKFNLGVEAGQLCVAASRASTDFVGETERAFFQVDRTRWLGFDCRSRFVLASDKSRLPVCDGLGADDSSAAER